MTATGPNVRTFLRFLTGRRTLLISAPFSRGVMFVLGNVIKPQGLEPLQFPTKFRAPSEFPQMALTDTTVRNAKPKEKPYKLGDSGGLFGH